MTERLEGFGPRHVPWDRAAPRRVHAEPETSAPDAAPTSRGGNVLSELDWYYRKGPTLLGHSLPLEWVPASTSHDDDGMNDAHRRFGAINRRLQRVLSLPGGPLLVWILRAWHGGSAGTDRASGAVESYTALLLGASEEEHERRVLMARDRLDACRGEVSRLAAIVHPQTAASKDEAKGKHRSRRRRRNVAAETAGRAAIGGAELELRLAKRSAAEAGEVVRVQRANDVARALAARREEWSAMPEDERKRAMSGLHAEAVRAYRETA